ncbi:MAG: STAS domain-containing protein [Chloroflexia bacterium]|nr:STAS domain-containing protein [Chloroflexia bacterium]
MMNWWRQRGLRFKFILGVVLILSIVLGLVLYSALQSIRDQLKEREQQTALQLNELVGASIESAHMREGWGVVQGTIEELGTRSGERGKQAGGAQIEDIAIYAFVEEEGTGYVYHRSVLVNFATGFPNGRTIQQASLEEEQQDPACDICHRIAPRERPNIVELELEGETVIRTVIALKNQPRCQSCHLTDRETLGVSLVDFGLRDYRQTANSITLWLGGGGALAIVLALAALFFLLHRTVLSPVDELLTLTRLVAQGNWNRRAQVRSGDEMGRLGDSFNEMTTQLESSHNELAQSLQQQMEQSAALQLALQKVQEGQEQQAELQKTILEMSTPVVPVSEGVLVMPLIGAIGSERAQQIRQALLAAIEQERAQVVILDITGVPVVDTAVAQALLGAAQAARLLGTEPVLVGITPQVAETIVSLGVDLAGLTTRSDLQSGVSYALGRLRQ